MERVNRSRARKSIVGEGGGVIFAPSSPVEVSPTKANATFCVLPPLPHENGIHGRFIKLNDRDHECDPFTLVYFRGSSKRESSSADGQKVVGVSGVQDFVV